MQRNMWDRKEDALNRRLEALAAREDWEGVLRELDQYDANNERRHQEHRDDFDLALLDDRSCEDEPYQIPRRLCIFREEAWLDIIFSQREEDLPELVSEYPLSATLRELTPQQREILRLNLVFGIPAGRLLKELGAPPEISPSFGRRRWRNFGILWAAASQRQHLRRRVDCPKKRVLPCTRCRKVIY